MIIDIKAARREKYKREIARMVVQNTGKTPPSNTRQLLEGLVEEKVTSRDDVNRLLKQLSEIVGYVCVVGFVIT